jgi:hypothetical protein
MKEMKDVSAVISVGEKSAGELAELLKPFPRGSRVRVLLSEEPPAGGRAESLEAYLARVETARQSVPPSPWQSSEEALRELREGERD